VAVVAAVLAAGGGGYAFTLKETEPPAKAGAPLVTRDAPAREQAADGTAKGAGH
jgi:hypothetical protein